MTVTTADGEVEDVTYTGSAPLNVRFEANPTDVGEYTPLYEWRFYAPGQRDNPSVVRYDEDTDFTFTTSGTTIVELLISFVQGQDTVTFEMDEPFQITVSESMLELPNAFSPNGDGINDRFIVRHQSLVSFNAYIFNRWGQEIYSWSLENIDEGWDGTYKGRTVSNGVYFIVVEAVGADGIEYKKKSSINVLTATNGNLNNSTFQE